MLQFINKNISQILYELQSQGTVVRSATNPPVWTLTPEGSQLPPIDTHNNFSSQGNFVVLVVLVSLFKIFRQIINFYHQKVVFLQTLFSSPK